MTQPSEDAERPSDPVGRLSEYGWIVESLPSGAVCLRTSGLRRGCMLGFSVGVLLLLGVFTAFVYFLGSGFWEDAPGDRILLAFLTLMSLLFVGTVGMAVVAIVLQILWLLLVREEWEVDTNRLEIRRRLLGLSWSRHYSNGVLMLESKYTKEAEPFRRLAVNCDGQKHYLIRETAISDHSTGISFGPSRDEIEAIADLLAQHTGWPVIWAEREAAEVVRSIAGRRELPAELRAAGFHADVDEQLRLTIRRHALGQIGCGLIPLVLGGISLIFIVCGVQDMFVDHKLTFGETLWLAPWLMVGLVFVSVGFVIIFSRERWIVDRNLFIIRSQTFGWKSEKQYVDGTFNLLRVSHNTEDGRAWSWELQLQNRAGSVLNALYSDNDDDLPRLLGTVLSQYTGWPLHEVED